MNSHCGCAQEVKGYKKNRVVLEDMKENAVAETPAVGPSSRDVPFTPVVPATLMRVPKLGETFYSQKGKAPLVVPVLARFYSSTASVSHLRTPVLMGHGKRLLWLCSACMQTA